MESFSDEAKNTWGMPLSVLSFYTFLVFVGSWFILFSLFHNTTSSIKFQTLLSLIADISGCSSIIFISHFNRVIYTVHRGVFFHFHFRWIYYCHSKDEIISKCLFGVFNFFQKMNENTSKNEFIRSFFGRILGLTIFFEINWPLVGRVSVAKSR